MESSGKTLRPDSEAVAIDLSQSSNDVHDLLRGGRPNYQNKMFSESQMEALTSLCDTLVPSLDFNGISNSNNAQDNDELRSFYGILGIGIAYFQLISSPPIITFTL